MAFLTNNGYNFSVLFETGRYKRQSSVYDSIAQATGGDVERFSSSQDLADKVQEDLMVILFSFFSPFENNKYRLCYYNEV